MKITLDNYGLWMVDYLDDSLPDSDRSEFEFFLQEHPEINEELLLIKGLENKPIACSHELHGIDFSYLKKLPEITIAPEILIAYMEGDLIGSEKADCERKLVLYPNNKTELAWYIQSKLIPETSVFENKENLKKPIARKLSLPLAIFTAAACLLFIGFLAYFIKEQSLKTRMQSDATEMLISPSMNAQKVLSTKEIIKVKHTNFNKIASNCFSREALKVTWIADRKGGAVLEKGIAIKKPEINLVHEPAPICLSKKEYIEKPFLNPAEFLVQKIKEEVFVNVGLSFHSEINPETQVKRYGLISKYFAYERIVKTN